MAPDAREPSLPVVLRAAEAADGPAIWKLVRDSRVLDLNSLYSYLLICRHFGDTCVVAETSGEDVAPRGRGRERRARLGGGLVVRPGAVVLDEHGARADNL